MCIKFVPNSVDFASQKIYLPCTGSQPRYIRVNTIKSTSSEVIKALTSQGYTQSETGTTTSGSKWFSIDKDLENLLVLPAYTDLHRNLLLINGSIIIQDKV